MGAGARKERRHGARAPCLRVWLASRWFSGSAVRPGAAKPRRSPWRSAGRARDAHPARAGRARGRVPTAPRPRRLLFHGTRRAVPTARATHRSSLHDCARSPHLRAALLGRPESAARAHPASRGSFRRASASSRQVRRAGSSGCAWRRCLGLEHTPAAPAGSPQPRAKARSGRPGSEVRCGSGRRSTRRTRRGACPAASLDPAQVIGSAARLPPGLPVGPLALRPHVAVGLPLSLDPRSAQLYYEVAFEANQPDEVSAIARGLRF